MVALLGCYLQGAEGARISQGSHHKCRIQCCSSSKLESYQQGHSPSVKVTYCRLGRLIAGSAGAGAGVDHEVVQTQNKDGKSGQELRHITERVGSPSPSPPPAGEAPGLKVASLVWSRQSS